MPYIIDDYEYIAKRMRELKKTGVSTEPAHVEDEEELEVDDVLIVGYSGDFFY